MYVPTTYLLLYLYSLGYFRGLIFPTGTADSLITPSLDGTQTGSPIIRYGILEAKVNRTGYLYDRTTTSVSRTHQQPPPPSPAPRPDSDPELLILILNLILILILVLGPDPAVLGPGPGPGSVLVLGISYLQETEDDDDSQEDGQCMYHHNVSNAMAVQACHRDVDTISSD